ncbi:MAG: alpha-2-macroglobulin family protein, partial [Bradymonadaceae bacterium]
AVSDVRGRQWVLLNDPRLVVPEAEQDMVMEESEGAPMMKRSRSVMPMSAPAMEMMVDSAPGGGAASPIAVRENFDALAFFEPAMRTDDKGRATVDVKIPDSLTRYRIMAVAVQGDTHYGTGESNLTARLPLMVRPSAPRFLNFGDEMELPVVLQNQTQRDMNVHVVVRGQNLEWTGPTGMLVTVPAQNRVEVRFPAKTQKAGTARVQVGAASADWSDAAQLEFPIWTPATTEAFATYGVVDDGTMFQPVKLPGDIFHQFGGLEITTSSTQLQALTDAFIYLVSYPYGCAEQISSRVLSVAALRDVLTAFEAEGLPDAKEIEAMVRRDLVRISELQNGDGGFGFWRRGEASWPYSTVHVTHALARAKQKGYDVPEQTLTRAHNYLRSIDRRIPGHYSRHSRNTIIASALYVRLVLGDQDAAAARQLFDKEGFEHLSMEALGWLMSVMAQDGASSTQLDKIRRHFENKVEETAATAEFTSSYGEHGYLVLHSPRRTDAVILDALIRAEPQSDLIPKIVQGLLAHRVRGRWGNTQENVFILLALDHYFNVYEKVTPDFVARAWLGDGFVGEHEFKGRTTERHHMDVPFSHLAKSEGGESVLALDKDGAGRMYYRVGMRYAPTSLKLEAADHGFAVERIYEAVDDPRDVRRLDEDTWQIRPGARVKITVTMATPARRYHVALVDPLPAGLEAMNPALATTADIPQDPGQMSRGGRWWWWGPWYQHQNMRDERVEAFATLVWGGVHSYTYYARATTPGEFVVPPAKAEEMYHPETFGRTASTRVIVR